MAGIGETVTMSATLTGYENTVYTLQWQSSKDNAHWSDLPGATGSQFTTTVTPENAFDYWRIQVTVNEII